MWEQLESGRVRHRFEPVVIAATLALIPVFILEAEASSSRWEDIAYALNWLIWVIFVAELTFILVVAPRKAAALRAHWLDALIVVVTAPAFGAFLSSLRLLRLARLLRLLRLGAILTRLLQRERTVTSGTAFRFASLLTLLVIVIAGAAQSLVDSGDFKTSWDGIWWAIETVTTVGYGDLHPTTVQGRIIAIVVMLFGIGFLSVLTAAIASRFVKTERGDETEEILASLGRLEGELAELKQHVLGSPERPGETFGSEHVAVSHHDEQTVGVTHTARECPAAGKRCDAFLARGFDFHAVGSADAGALGRISIIAARRNPENRTSREAG